MSLDMNITARGGAMDAADSETEAQSSAVPWLRGEDVIAAMAVALAVTLASSIAVVMYLA
jgi:hypothetical protein